ncbi:MAG: hypothetical protein OHK0046_09330 [Anaerolineae bacterium]
MSRHSHPHPGLNRLTQYSVMVLVGLMLLSVPLQIALNFLGAPGGGFILSALLTLLLIAPLVMLTAATPEVSAADEGLTLHPLLWKDRFVPWGSISAVKVYPLLPAREAEVNRRVLVGKKRYRPAEGVMLVIPELPPQYRIAGFFAGERGKPIIALTNRAHTDYEHLVETVLAHTPEAIHDLDTR